MFTMNWQNASPLFQRKENISLTSGRLENCIGYAGPRAYFALGGVFPLALCVCQRAQRGLGGGAERGGMVSVGRDQCGRAQYPPARTDGSDHTEFSPLAFWCLSAGLGQRLDALVWAFTSLGYIG